MNKKYITVLFFLMLNQLISCNYFIAFDQVKSKWSELDQIKPVQCFEIPIPEDHLNLSEVNALMKDDQLFGFWLQAIDRQGHKNTFVYKLDQLPLQFDPNKFINISSPDDSLLTWIGSRSGLIIYKDEDVISGRSFLIVKDIDNQQILRHEINHESIDMKLADMSSNILIQYDSQPHIGIDMIDLKKRSIQHDNFFKDLQLRNFFSIVNNNKNKYLVLHNKMERNISEKTEGLESADDRQMSDVQNEDHHSFSKFEIIKSSTGEKIRLPQKLTRIKSPVEDWSVNFLGDQIYLAVILGDTLIGRANLEFFQMTIEKNKLNISKERSFILDGSQIGSLFWEKTLSHSELKLYFLRWVDGESMLARFKISNDDIKPDKTSGIFPAGSAIINLFHIPPGHGLYSLMRTKKQNDLKGWEYKICAL